MKTELPLSEKLLQKLPNPCYVLDKRLLDRNLSVIARAASAAGVEVILALKGFAMWKAFRYLRRAGFTNATASSLNEALLAHKEMKCRPYTYAVTYTDEELPQIAKLSGHLTFNSLAQYRRHREAARKANRRISFGIRVNPEISSVGTDLYNPCVEGSRLGVRACDLPLPEELPSDVEGFHCHALCESGAEASVNLVNRFEEKFGGYINRLKWVNFGGGHLMTRQGYDLQMLIDRLKAFRAAHPHLHVILEPGAAFVWETGYLLARVEDVVHNVNEGSAIPPTAVMNVSFTAHMPDCLEMPYMAKIFGAVYEGQEENPDPRYACRYRLGGNSCLAGDYMGDWFFEQPLQSGDILLFKDMIHYTFVKTTMFNGVHHPALCMVDKDRVLFCRRFGYNDFKRRLS